MKQPGKRQPKKRRPGRPAGDKERLTPEHILDAAEREFAMNGYTKTSLREIAERVQINQALISYYFGDKLRLFEEVMKRRGNEIARRHIELLDELESAFDPVPLHLLVTAFLTPNFELRDQGPNGLSFMRLLAQLHFQPNETTLALRREIYDASVKRYVKAFIRTMPQVAVIDILWRINFIVGSVLYMFSGNYRIQDLSDGEYVEQWDRQAIIERMTNFIINGIAAPA
jgi:AcrR family transcriptional regulator